MFALTLGVVMVVGTVLWNTTFTRRSIKRPAVLRPLAITLRQVGLHALRPSWKIRVPPFFSLFLFLSLSTMKTLKNVFWISIFYVPMELKFTGLAVELYCGPGEDVQAGTSRVEPRIRKRRLAEIWDITRRPVVELDAVISLWEERLCWQETLFFCHFHQPDSLPLYFLFLSGCSSKSRSSLTLIHTLFGLNQKSPWFWPFEVVWIQTSQLRCGANSRSETSHRGGGLGLLPNESWWGLVDVWKRLRCGSNQFWNRTPLHMSQASVPTYIIENMFLVSIVESFVVTLSDVTVRLT